MASSSNNSAGNKFMPSGYDYEFVEEVPEDYHCSICFYPMWKPVQTKCGHRFCEGCLKEANKRRKPPQCPEDRQELRKQDIFYDRALERRILSLEIKCPNDGCQWQGALGDLKDHTCSPVGSERRGGQQGKKKKIADPPAEERSLTLVPCVYQRFGCNVKIPRRDMDRHIMDSIHHHFHITSERFLLLENENLQLKKGQKEVEQKLKASFLKEKEERENISKELTSLKTYMESMEEKWLKMDRNLQSLSSQKGEFSKEIKSLRKQIKQQVEEKPKADPNATVDPDMINKDMAGKIERSRLRMETSIDELSRIFDKRIKKTTQQLQKELDDQARMIRSQMQKANLESDRQIMAKSRKKVIVPRCAECEAIMMEKIILQRIRNEATDQVSRLWFILILYCILYYFWAKYWAK